MNRFELFFLKKSQPPTGSMHTELEKMLGGACMHAHIMPAFALSPDLTHSLTTLPHTCLGDDFIAPPTQQLIARSLSLSNVYSYYMVGSEQEQRACMHEHKLATMSIGGHTHARAQASLTRPRLG